MAAEKDKHFILFAAITVWSVDKVKTYGLIVTKSILFLFMSVHNNKYSVMILFKLALAGFIGFVFIACNEGST